MKWTVLVFLTLAVVVCAEANINIQKIGQKSIRNLPKGSIVKLKDNLEIIYLTGSSPATFRHQYDCFQVDGDVLKMNPTTFGVQDECFAEASCGLITEPTLQPLIVPSGTSFEIAKIKEKTSPALSGNDSAYTAKISFVNEPGNPVKGLWCQQKPGSNKQLHISDLLNAVSSVMTVE